MRWAVRREKMRAILDGAACVRPASVFDPLSARAAENLGFELAVLAGSTASLTVLGAPDVVLLTASELAQQALRICRAAQLPLLVDADHGYGNAVNVIRTIEELEIAGIAAATIEDTALPTPFGTTGKSRLVSLEEGLGKMRAAVAARRDSNFVVAARTSAPIISNLEDAIRRLSAYERAGVDALFVVGLKTTAELDAVSSATRLPLMLGTISTELESADLAQWRVRVALQGHAPILAAAQAVHDTLKALREGCRPSAIGRRASDDLMRLLTRAAVEEAAARAYLLDSHDCD